MKLLSFGIYYLVCVALLMITFRIDEYLRNFNFAAESTISKLFFVGVAIEHGRGLCRPMDCISPVPPPKPGSLGGRRSDGRDHFCDFLCAQHIVRPIRT